MFEGVTCLTGVEGMFVVSACRRQTDLMSSWNDFVLMPTHEGFAWMIFGAGFGRECWGLESILLGQERQSGQEMA